MSPVSLSERAKVDYAGWSLWRFIGERARSSSCSTLACAFTQCFCIAPVSPLSTVSCHQRAELHSYQSYEYAPPLRRCFLLLLGVNPGLYNAATGQSCRVPLMKPAHPCTHLILHVRFKLSKNQVRRLFKLSLSQKLRTAESLYGSVAEDVFSGLEHPFQCACFCFCCSAWSKCSPATHAEKNINAFRS